MVISILSLGCNISSVRFIYYIVKHFSWNSAVAIKKAEGCEGCTDSLSTLLWLTWRLNWFIEHFALTDVTAALIHLDSLLSHGFCSLRLLVLTQDLVLARIKIDIPWYLYSYIFCPLQYLYSSCFYVTNNHTCTLCFVHVSMLSTIRDLLCVFHMFQCSNYHTCTLCFVHVSMLPTITV